MPQNAFFLRTRDLLVNQNNAKTLFSTLHPLSMVIFATATVLAFVLLRDSRFNFHCYTQCEATPTQKSAQKCAATSHNFLRERLQSTFTLANQLRWIAQYHRASEITALKSPKQYDQAWSPHGWVRSLDSQEANSDSTMLYNPCQLQWGNGCLCSDQFFLFALHDI